MVIVDNIRLALACIPLPDEVGIQSKSRTISSPVVGNKARSLSLQRDAHTTQAVAHVC